MTIKRFSILLSIPLFLLSGCKKKGDGLPGLVVVKSPVAQIDMSAVQQTIRGFGGSSAWSGALTDAEMTTLYGNSGPDEFGLSILRVRIDPGGSSKWAQELANAQKAIAHGGIVFATPWSPPANMKSNHSTTNGGKLDTAFYSAYAAYLNSFATYMSANGAPLYAISVQNEPDFSAPYESCIWAPADMFNFVKNYAQSISSTKLMASESYHFDHAYTDPILNDDIAASHIAVVGGHIYGSGLNAYPLAVNKGKEVWMTEHQDTDTSWSGAMSTAQEINDCMTTGNFNAYVFWWLKKSWGLIDSFGSPTKRGYAIGQFAKYIRPGYQRISAPYEPTTNVFMSAYKNGNHVVILAINNSDSSVSQPLQIINGTAPLSFTQHTISNGPVLFSGASVYLFAQTFTCILPAQSITTLVSN